MKQLTCEMCEGTNLIKIDGSFTCQSCGTKYSVEEAKKMMLEETTLTLNKVQQNITTKEEHEAQHNIVDIAVYDEFSDTLQTNQAICHTCEITPKHINNLWVWLLVVAVPLLALLLDAIVSIDNGIHLGMESYTTPSLGLEYLLLIIPFLNGLFAGLDFDRLKKAGIDLGALGILGMLLLVPLYLIVRASKTKKFTHIFIWCGWLALFILIMIADSTM